MFRLTSHERKVLILIGVLILSGSVLRFFSLGKEQVAKKVSQELNRPVDSAGQLIVNVNKASREELVKLPGIGPAIAGRIVDYRTQNGRFSTVNQLKKVKGIGEKKIAAFREHIVF